VELALTLWLLKHGAESSLDPANPPTLPRPGLTSLLVDKALPPAFYRVAGFHPCGVRAVRIDMLERLADLIRPLVAWRPDAANANPPPKGATGDGGFRVTPEMMSILGCSSSNVGEVLAELGFRPERVPVRPDVRPDVRPEAPGSDVPATEVASAEDATSGPDADSAAEARSGADAGPDTGAVGAAADTVASPAPEAVVAAAGSNGEPAPAGEAARPIEAASGEAPTAGEAAATIVATAVAASSETPAAAEHKSAAEPKFEEIWRPRRQGRHHERGDRARHRRGPPPPAAQAAREAGENGHQRHGSEGRDGRSRQHGRNDQHERRDRQDRPGRGQGRHDSKERRHGPGRRDDRREERQPRVFRHSASPAPKPGVDPDSPFAALSSLKAALEKQSQE
jgi:ATP-dependent RNA helicase SUPV3L1/SUV3